jgi:hypothetical protein
MSMVSCGGSSSTPSPSPTPVPPAASVPAASVPATSGALPSIGLPVVLPSGVTVPGASSLGGAPDAGSIVTANMAASVIGGSPQKVAMPGVGGGVASIVAYTTSEGGSMTVLVEKVPGGVAAAAMQAAIQMAGAKGDLQTVGGIGDAAGKVVDANEATLAFAKSGYIVVLGAESGSTAGTDLEPKLEALAQQIIGKL